MKLSVDQPPPLNRNGDSRGNRFRNQTSNAHDRFEFLLKCARKPGCRDAASPPARRPACSRSPARAADTARTRAQKPTRIATKTATCTRSDANAEQEQERVAQADLRERVLERPVGLRPLERAEEDAEEDQRRAAPDRRAPSRRANGLAPGAAAGDRERQRRADQERERRLDQIVERAALPRHVRGVVGDDRPEPARRETRRAASTAASPRPASGTSRSRERRRSTRSASRRRTRAPGVLPG